MIYLRLYYYNNDNILWHFACDMVCDDLQIIVAVIIIIITTTIIILLWSSL